MRVLACLMTTLAVAASAHAQDAPPTSVTAPREHLAIGVLATPALEGGGPWLLSAIRLSAPLGAKFGIDVDAGRVLGATSQYSEIRSYYTGQVRFVRSPANVEGSSRYWLVGLMYLRSTKLDGQGGVRNRKPHTALSAGHGWSHAFQNGARLVNEVGFSGGDSFMVYANLGIQWGPPRSKRP
jgi:hypothetical protein